MRLTLLLEGSRPIQKADNMPWLNKKTVLLILVGIIVYWIVDTAIDGYFFLHYQPRQIFTYILLAPAHEIFMRSSTILVIIVFGLLLTRYAFYLNESEGRFRQLFDNIDDPVFVQEDVTEDSPGKFVEVNLAGCRNLGCSREELLQISPLEIFSPETHPHLRARMSQILAGGQGVFESILLTKNGRKIPVEIKSHLFELAGRPKVLSIARDISERQRAEAALQQAHGELELRVAERTAELAQANLELTKEIAEGRRKEEQLRASEGRFRTLVQTAGSVIVLLCPDGRILEFNEEAERVSGWQRREVLEADAVQLFIPEGERDRAKENLRKGLAGEMIRGLEMPARMRDGTERLFSWNLSPFLDPAGLTAGLIVVGEDITARKQHELELRKSEEKLRSLTAQLLVAEEQERRRLSMELHDELGQALMYLKYQMGLISKKLAEARNPLKVESEVLLDYVDGVIENVRRLSRDLGPSVLEELGLSSALRYLLEEFSERYKLRNLQVEIDELDDLFPPQAQLYIFRILQESLTNIFRHAQASRVSVTVKKGVGSVSMVVEDNGRGFDLQQNLAMVGDQGGVGLAALQERVRILGGTLDIWSQLGVGTRITCHLPLAGKDPENEAISNPAG